MKKTFLITAVLILIAGNSAYSQYYLNEKTPKRIIINLTESPAESIAVTWRTIGEINNPEVQVAEATDWIEFENNIRSTTPKSTRLITDKDFAVYHHSAIMNELKANTLYTYRVGGDSEWSEWSQFRTAKDTNAPFRFVFLGDTQNDIKEHCSRVFMEAFKTAPDAAFWMIPGDLTNEPVDNQFHEFFYAGGSIFKTIPSIFTADNHDFDFLKIDGVIVEDSTGKRQKSDQVSTIFMEHFTLPENGTPGFDEMSYYIDYQGVRIIMINVFQTEKLQDQMTWLENILANNPNKWTVVSFHKPFYSAGRDRDNRETRDAFLPLFDKYNVDLVLTGHDHAYARSHKLKDGVRVADNEKGTVYVVSMSGPKMYSVNSNYDHIMAKTGGNVQLFQVISIDGGELSYKSYTATGNLYDSFNLSKTSK